MQGAIYASERKFSVATGVTVTAGGAIGITRAQHTVTDNGGPGAGADDLDSITKPGNLVDGDEVTLRITAGGSPITLRHGIGTIRCPYGQNVTISDATDMVRLRYNGTAWTVIESRILANTSDPLTVAAGAVTVTRSEHTVLGQDGLDDDLDTINGGQIGVDVVLRPGNPGPEDITLTTIGNIELNGQDAIVLASARDYVKIRWDGAIWKVIEENTARGPRGLEASNINPGADASVVGRIPVVYRSVVPNGLGNTDIVITYGSRVIRAWYVKTVGAGDGNDLVRLFNGAAAITDAMVIPAADTQIVRSGQIDTANHQIAAGGTLRWTVTMGGTVLGETTGFAFVLANLT